MTCPNCGKQYEHTELSDKNQFICSNCGADTTLYKNAVRMSNALYNKGLAKAKVSDLSGALECLSKSVRINKNNTNARNILGLVQYEIGHVGDALKNWVISCGLKREDNPASKYIEAIQKNARALERLNDAIRIYNQALGDIMQKSDDMAIIKLKQAVDLNPRFVDALNLLTFCYLIQKDKAKAQSTAERVLAIDSTNNTALGYYDELNPGIKPVSGGRSSRKRGGASGGASASRPVSPYKKVTLYDRRNVNFHLEGILCLVIGVVCTLGVILFLVNPALARSQANQIDDMQTRLSQMEQTYDNLVAEKDQQIEILQAESSEHAESADYWAERYDNLGRSVQVLSAFELFRENRLREAVDAIGGISTEGLAPDIAERFNEIINVAHPQLARQYYNEGFAAYHARDFEKARVDFERAYRYVQNTGDTALLGDIIYYLAWTYSQGIDIDLAINYFERLLEEFSNHRYTRQAQNRLNEISS